VKNGSNGRGMRLPARSFQRQVKGTLNAGVATLSAEASAIVRDQLVAELEALGLRDELDFWTLRAWPKANTLTPEDGDVVRQAFQVRLQGLVGLDLSGAEPDPPGNANVHSRIDKSVLALPEIKRLRDKQHLRFVAKQPCLVCGREPSDPHHLRFAQSRGLGLKVSDEFAVPLCRAHHRELHRAGKEVDWWARIGIEPIDIARRLWIETHPLIGSASLPAGDGAALETKLPINKMEMAKRTQLPGTPT
jgi:hypothetical protein